MARPKPADGLTPQQRWRKRNPSYWKAREPYNRKWNRENGDKKNTDKNNK